MTLRLQAAVERWPLKSPFVISGYTFEAIEVVAVTLEQNGRSGRGEASGVYYLDDTPAAMLKTVERVRSDIERGIDRSALQRLLPPGGARNALDCALWDLEAKLTGVAAWKTIGIDELKPVRTTFTCSADTPEGMAKVAASYTEARGIKLKLTGSAEDGERVRAVRAACPDVWLSIDANQGFDRPRLEGLMHVLQETDVQLIEQPFPLGRDDWLDGFGSPISIAADESCQGLADVARLAERYDTVNIKLDKCGGLTEALAMVSRAKDLGLSVMVGNMFGTSLAMAPGCVVGQHCTVADLDGPLFLQADREPAADYRGGEVSIPAGLWGI